MSLHSINTGPRREQPYMCHGGAVGHPHHVGHGCAAVGEHAPGRCGSSLPPRADDAVVIDGVPGTADGVQGLVHLRHHMAGIFLRLYAQEPPVHI